MTIASQQQGFVIYHGDQQIDKVASWVSIINFEQGNDDVLIIDVQCKALVSLSQFELEHDGLSFAQAHAIEHWQTPEPSFSQQTDTVSKKLALALDEVINQHSVLKALYCDAKVDSPYWTVARWIELLPLPYADKRAFIQPDSYESAKNFVYAVVIDQDSTQSR